ncbi:hypothetical protein KHS38_14270 [Mucilaginibacter sp. Bleaf8]|uniref:hypothetical protein n=1 Tax=Mucilaginibacter sp. Bleaf8 TaxID=2834430 RepID=UPI001BCD8430|nr:hypothetical protein [Mucilaginibacter sp. Bleaf8]MBS7565575.1 hypothetical protein [Mucilaginibacter sp. Bleaf8]
MKNESLTGSLVLVHPDFKDDPVQRQGQVGVMTYPRELNEMYVSFPGGGEGVYSWDTLLKLKDKQDIVRNLTSNGSAMPENDFKALYKIMLLMDRGTSLGTLSALEMARDNPSVWERALDPVRQIERLDAHKSYGR